jgi:hypothetical protein
MSNDLTQEQSPLLGESDHINANNNHLDAIDTTKSQEPVGSRPYIVILFPYLGLLLVAMGMLDAFNSSAKPPWLPMLTFSAA